MIKLLHILLLLCGISFMSLAQTDHQSPYFQIKGDQQEVEHFPLLQTKADVNILGIIAEVKVTQLYSNQGKEPIEAIYIFPASTNAAVNGMQMTIGERTIKAKIEEKEKARKDYEQAKQEGKNTSPFGTTKA